MKLLNTKIFIYLLQTAFTNGFRKEMNKKDMDDIKIRNLKQLKEQV